MGDERRVVVGYVNKGPGMSRESETAVVFTVPPGARVTKVPFDPELAEEGDPQHCARSDDDRTYVCELSNTVGRPQTFAFTLRIVARDDRPGSVRILYPEAASKDPVAGDNSAPVRLTVTRTATNHSGTDDSGHDSGTSPEVWAAVAGGTAVLLAAELLLRRRRRRTA
ncbi:hypothetical protein ABT026_21040 [Streptomyces sp. NPDC002734]|uniref:hypothetical protein n=1 Tax=Streptomyces sp. NPDC002734 TaxID=3154426 RepID=UPI00332F426D